MAHFLNEYVLMRFTTFPEGTLAKIQFAKYFFNDPPVSPLWTQGQAITPVATFLTLCERCVGSLTFPPIYYREDEGDRAYGLQSLFE